MAPGTANIYFTDPQKKVPGGLGLSLDRFLDCLVPDVFLTTLLLGLGTDRGL